MTELIIFPLVRTCSLDPQEEVQTFIKSTMLKIIVTPTDYTIMYVYVFVSVTIEAAFWLPCRQPALNVQ